MFLIHESPNVHPTISKAEKAYIERNVDVHKVRLFVIGHVTKRLIDCFVDRLIDIHSTMCLLQNSNGSISMEIST